MRPGLLAFNLEQSGARGSGVCVCVCVTAVAGEEVRGDKGRALDARQVAAVKGGATAAHHARRRHVKGAGHGGRVWRRGLVRLCGGMGG